MKVEIFYFENGNEKDGQEEINNWIRRNSSVRIISICMSSSNVSTRVLIQYHIIE